MQVFSWVCLLGAPTEKNLPIQRPSKGEWTIILHCIAGPGLVTGPSNKEYKSGISKLNPAKMPWAGRLRVQRSSHLAILAAIHE
jgi:hypothetical protein